MKTITVEQKTAFEALINNDKAQAAEVVKALKELGVSPEGDDVTGLRLQLSAALDKVKIGNQGLIPSGSAFRKGQEGNLVPIQVSSKANRPDSMEVHGVIRNVSALKPRSDKDTRMYTITVTYVTKEEGRLVRRTSPTIIHKGHLQYIGEEAKETLANFHKRKEDIYVSLMAELRSPEHTYQVEAFNEEGGSLGQVEAYFTSELQNLEAISFKVTNGLQAQKELALLEEQERGEVQARTTGLKTYATEKATGDATLDILDKVSSLSEDKQQLYLQLIAAKNGRA